jgi:hypothetical protein
MKLDWPLFNLWLKNKEKATPNKNMLYVILFIKIVFFMFFLNILNFYFCSCFILHTFQKDFLLKNKLNKFIYFFISLSKLIRITKN